MIRWLLKLMITSMIFFPEKTLYENPKDYGLAFEDVEVVTSDGVKLHGWFLKANPEKGAMLFLHGNAGNISHRLFKVKGWVERGFSVLLIDYRGYGKSEGKIQHGDDVMEDAAAALDWLLGGGGRHAPLLQRIILYGESLGSAPAIRLASENEVTAIILEGPFTSFSELARTHYPFVPEFVLRDFEFRNLNRIGELKSPLFIMHGTHDEVCPHAMGERLFESAPAPKKFFSVPKGNHNDLPTAAGEEYWEKPYEFISKYL